MEYSWLFEAKRHNLSQSLATGELYASSNNRFPQGYGFTRVKLARMKAIAHLPANWADIIIWHKENIHVYDLHEGMSLEKLMKYDAIYFCGGNTQYLLDRINEIKFNTTLKEYVQKGGIFVGVSAGSIIAAQNLPNNLGFINCLLSVHCEKGTDIGKINTSDCQQIKLTDSQAILLTDNGAQVIE